MSRFQFEHRTAFTRPRVYDTRNQAHAEFETDDAAARVAEALSSGEVLASFLIWTSDHEEKEPNRG